LALSVPLSRFTSRVGGGSAFYVRQHYTLMNYSMIILLVAIPIFFLLGFAIIIPRFQMERRAHILLAQHPDSERTSVYLPLHSTWAWQKQREIDAKIADMKVEGWSFLRGREASPLRTIFSWGGGLTLHFIRTKV
jgi:hypothetical protein